MILRSVAEFARPQQTRDLFESLFCLLAQVFGDMAAAGCVVWGQMTYLVLSAVLPGPCWTLFGPELVLIKGRLLVWEAASQTT